jgi:hypothetical protein
MLVLLLRKIMTIWQRNNSLAMISLQPSEALCSTLMTQECKLLLRLEWKKIKFWSWYSLTLFQCTNKSSLLIWCYSVVRNELFMRNHKVYILVSWQYIKILKRSHLNSLIRWWCWRTDHTHSKSLIIYCYRNKKIKSVSIHYNAFVYSVCFITMLSSQKKHEK